MVPRPRKIVEKTYYYATDSESDSEFDFDYEPARDSESESESDATTVVFGECDWELEEVSDSEDGTDYESETEPESDSEELDDPKPYYGKGSVSILIATQTKVFMRAFGFHDP
jgi:hypothetical protein